MRSLLAIFQHKYIMLAGMGFGWFEVVALPKPMLLVLLLGAMVVDLITGLIKSWMLGKATTSAGLRKTVAKVGVYVGVILGVWFLANILDNMDGDRGIDYTWFVNSSIGFLTFIEVYSVFENVYAIDPNSIVSRKFVKPVLKFLRGKLNEHPIDNLKTDTDEQGN